LMAERRYVMDCPLWRGGSDAHHPEAGSVPGLLFQP